MSRRRSSERGAGVPPSRELPRADRRSRGEGGQARRADTGSTPSNIRQPLPAVSRLLPAVFIVLVGLGAYANSFNGVFVLDEQSAIVDNPNIRSLAASFSAPKEVGFAGRPVVSLSFALNYLLAPSDVREVFAPPPPGADPAAANAIYRNLWGYHAVNLAIHLIAALALFGILRRTLASPRLTARFATATTPLSLIVALLWVAHPLNTGSITYVAQRVESLMGMFFLLTLYCSIRAAEAGDWLRAAGRMTGAATAAGTAAATGAGTGKGTSAGTSAGTGAGTSAGTGVARDVGQVRPANARRAWTAAAVAFCALGMGAKEVMVAAPLIVFLYDLVFAEEHDPEDPARGSRIQTARVKALLSARWPLYAGFALCWLLLAALVLSNPRTASIGVGLAGWSSWLYLETQAAVIVHYLRLAVVPWPLVLDYEWPAATSLASVLPQLLLLAALLALTLRGLWRLKPVALLGAWFFLILAPSSSVLPIVTEIAAEHRMYLPLAAVITLIVAGAYRAGARYADRREGAAMHCSAAPGGVPVAVAAPRQRPTAGPARIAALTLAAVAVAGCAYLTRARNEDYTSYQRIWADTVARRPDNARARSNYGTVLFEQGRLPQAEAQLRKAIEIRSAYPEAQANLGAVLCSKGQLDEGIEHLQRAIALAPDYRDAYRNLGEALATLGRNTEALDAYRKAIATAPNDPRLLSRIAWLLATSPEESIRDGRSALRFAERAVQITDGHDADSLDTLAAAYAELGRFNDAVATEERALALAQSAGLGAMMPDMQMRLEMYRAGQKFRQVAPQRG